jgi:hypothetical protein
MELRPLGRTGVQVSPLCLGAMMFGPWGNDDRTDAVACVSATTKVRKRTGWHELHANYQLICERTGEVLTIPVDNVVSGKWAQGQSLPRRTARQNMMLVARCDAAWRKIYGLETPPSEGVPRPGHLPPDPPARPP